LGSIFQKISNRPIHYIKFQKKTFIRSARSTSTQLQNDQNGFRASHKNNNNSWFNSLKYELCECVLHFGFNCNQIVEKLWRRKWSVQPAICCVNVENNFPMKIFWIKKFVRDTRQCYLFLYIISFELLNFKFSDYNR
jgi:hypothetical protein